jgi:anti-anti-sigma factor
MSERRWLRLPVKRDPSTLPDGTDRPAAAAGVNPRADVAATVTGPSGTPLLTVTVQPERPDGSRPGPLVVAAAGEVDLDTAPLLRVALFDAVDRRSVVCRDLTEVTFLSAAGVNALIAARNQALETGSRLTVRGARGITRRVLQVCGVERLLDGH